MNHNRRQQWESAGAVYSGERLEHFGDWRAEYRAATEAVAIFDRSDIAKVELMGRDRAKFLHNLCTQEIKRLEPGQGQEAFLPNAQGKILFFVRVFAASNSIWMDTVPGSASPLIAHMDRYCISEKVEMFDRTDQFGQMLVAGPRAQECLEATAATHLDLPNDLNHATATLAGEPCTILRNRSLGQHAFELRFAADRFDEVWQALAHAGKAMGLCPMGGIAFDALRVQAGWPVYGVDIDESNLPQEIGRTRQAISFTKGCYLGQETVARIDALGHVNRHLVGLLAPSEQTELPRGAKLFSGDKPAGHITSSVYSPLCQHAIALGYVRRGQERPGTELVIELDDRRVPAVVADLPFPG